VLVGWRGRQLGVAAGVTGALLFTGALQSGLLEGMAFWQQLTVLGATWAPGAVAWWKPRPDVPAIEGPAGPALPAEMEVLRQVLTDATTRERSPIVGGRIVALDHPAPQVATAVVHVPGIHVRRLPLDTLRDGLEALADAAGIEHPALGALHTGAVEIVPTGVSQLQVTVSWSRELAETSLAYNPPPGLPEGAVWLGKGEDRTDVLVQGWERGADGKVSCYHAKVIGKTGSGKSVSLRAMLIGGLKAGTELPIPLDAKGESLDELVAMVPGHKIARDADSWQRGVELFGAIFLSRKQRQGTPDAWTEPRPDDPMVTLILDEASVARLGLAPEHHEIVRQAGMQTRSLGMRVIQASQPPLVDDWVGGGTWRAQATITILHTMRDETHARIANQGLDRDLDLTRMPKHFAAVAHDSEITSAKCRVALITEGDVAAITTPMARLHPLDQQMAAGAWDAYIQAVTVGTPGQTETDPLAGLLTSLGTPGFQPGAQASQPVTTTTTAPAAPATQIPAQTRPDVIDLRQPQPQPAKTPGTLRQAILTRLMSVSQLPTRAQLVEQLQQPPYGWSRSGAHKAIGQMLEEGALIEEAGRIAPAILA
ncbi:MAG TPA: hypothetical protein VFP72_05720, partial [Kineosporiaceae bacterium]|nr:hypothetical protein [Kineosporiaceae bacterium]